MFATFKMELPDYTELNRYYQGGTSQYTEQQQNISSSLEKYLSPEGVLEVDEIEQDWFPTIKADVFLSHSHKDEKAVIAFAGYLKSLGLTAFIDSCVWGYSDKLLMDINEKYSVLDKQKDRTTYDYKKANLAASHVHMILNGALVKMLNTTECIIFLDTPNSLKVSGVEKSITGSPWIYSEILSTGLLRRIPPKREKRTFIYKSLQPLLENSQDLEMEYNVDTKHLLTLSIEDIRKIYDESKCRGKKLLDQIYLNKKICQCK